MKSKILHFVVTLATFLSITTISFARGPGSGAAANSVSFLSNVAVRNPTGVKLEGRAAQLQALSTSTGYLHIRLLVAEVQF